jgi:CPA2 family monovalent cation:H+ antiporter-2
MPLRQLACLLTSFSAGPVTPCLGADQALANHLEEIGAMLLMSAVGLHFSLEHAKAARAIALPGAVVQSAAAPLLGMTLAWAFGRRFGAGPVLGLVLSGASTVVLGRALRTPCVVHTGPGRSALG